VAEQVEHEKEISDQITDLKDELEKHYKRVKNPNDTFQESLSPLNKIALYVTEHVGTMGFFFIVLGWTLFWLAFNVLAPKSWKFDPYPAFVLWLIISNILQILLMPLLLIGQNIQGMRTDIRGEHDYETDQRAEKEIKTVLLHFDRQQRLMLKILESIEKLSEGPKPEESTTSK
jgi:uncharacterized membrane protein